jgi:hypothetical protein
MSFVKQFLPFIRTTRSYQCSVKARCICNDRSSVRSNSPSRPIEFVIDIVYDSERRLFRNIRQSLLVMVETLFPTDVPCATEISASIMILREGHEVPGAIEVYFEAINRIPFE